jgi:hypothetical protein
MSLKGILRFIFGIVLAGILLAVILPFVGVPSSHYLPPAWVYNKATGQTRGYITGKYAATSGNPFTIGAEDYFLNYTYKAPITVKGVPGPKQIFTGTVRVSQDIYNATGSAPVPGAIQPTVQQVTKEPYIPVRVKYEVTNPTISGLTGTWALTYENGRSIGPGSDNVGFWMIWIFVAIILGYFISILLGRFMAREEI